jgi:hypothetical protein
MFEAAKKTMDRKGKKKLVSAATAAAKAALAAGNKAAAESNSAPAINAGHENGLGNNSSAASESLSEVGAGGLPQQSEEPGDKMLVDDSDGVADDISNQPIPETKRRLVEPAKLEDHGTGTIGSAEDTEAHGMVLSENTDSLIM